MGSNPSWFKDCGDDCPVENVNWYDVQAYVKKLSEKTGQKYRLPSEAEWEYAARAGTTTTYASGDIIFASQANFFSKSGTNKVVSVTFGWENNFGLKNVHGNVSEWVQDCWHSNYVGAPQNGSAWETECTDMSRVTRGGNWHSSLMELRSSGRVMSKPIDRRLDTGFRIARNFSF